MYGAADAALGLSVDAKAPAASARACRRAGACRLTLALLVRLGRATARRPRRQAAGAQRGEARRAALKADTATYYHCSSCDCVRA